MQLGKAQLRDIWVQDRRKERRRLLTALALTFAVFVFCLCFRYNPYYFKDKFIPGVYMKELFLAARLGIARLSGSMNSGQIQQAVDAAGETEFLGALARLWITFQSFVAGGALALAGAIFQTVYKNPLASPDMLGASVGVKMGNILMITLYSSAALQLLSLRYRYCYLFTAICVAAVQILGRLAGNKSKNVQVVEMVMAGSVISQALNTFVLYYMYNLDEEDLLFYQELELGVYIQMEPVGMAVFSVVMAVAILPMLFLRFRFNAVALEGDEAYTSGINPGWLRLVGQVCGVLMVTAAMIHMGDVGIVALLLPRAVRTAVGADFKHVCIYSLLAGGILLMFCRLVASFFVIADLPLPVSFVVDFALIPVFFVVLARQKEDER